MAFQIPPGPQIETIEISRFTGANLNIDTTQISETESPDMLNITLDNDGTPDKRTGFETLFTVDGKVNGIFDYNNELVILGGTKVYKWREEMLTELYDGVTDTKASAFVFDANLYILNGHEYLVYDGSTIKPVEPYVPKIVISSPPTGGGTPFEEWNLLGEGFRQTFNTDGTAKTFKLSLDGLNGRAVTAKHLINDTVYTEGNGLTVDREKGEVTFNAAPAKAGDGVNELEITAYKTQEGFVERITGCNAWNIYGGSNDTRIHLYGNPNFTSRVFRSGLNDPTYWPENSFNQFGSESNVVTGKVNHYDSSVVFTRDGIYIEHFEFTADGEPSFPTRPVNSEVGCLAPCSVQLVENNPVFLSKHGVMMLVSSQVRDERNVQLLSEKINADLLKRSFDGVTSVEHNDKYMLFFPDGWVWIWNYRLNGWYPWNNIKATCSISVRRRYEEPDRQELFFGRADGSVCRFKRITDKAPYNDDGEAIKAKWSTKVFGFDAESYLKLVKNLHCTLRPGRFVGLDVSYRTSRKGAWTYLTTFMASLFDYTTVNYAKWTYYSNELPMTSNKKMKQKRIVYLQLRFENNESDESMGLLYLAIHFALQREVK